MIGVLPAVPDLRPVMTIIWLVIVALLSLALLVVGMWRHRTSASQRYASRTAIVLGLGGLILAGSGIGWIIRRLPRDVAARERPEHDDNGSSSDVNPGGEPSESTVDPERDWPTDRGSLLRLGARPGHRGPRDGIVRWHHRRAGESFLGAAAIDRDLLYAVGSTTDAGRIYAFDPASGDVRWAIRPSGQRPTFSSPIVVGERLYCGEGIHSTRQARLICVDLRPGREGRPLWTFPTASHIESTPTWDRGRVLFGAGDDGFYVVRDPRSGSLESLDTLETLELPAASSRVETLAHGRGSDYPDVEANVTVVGDRAYVPLGIDGQALVAFDLRTGSELGRLRFAFPIFAPPSVADGKLYVGLGQGDVITPDLPPQGQVICVDLERWQLDWTLPLAHSVLGAVAIADEQLLFGDSGGAVRIVSRAGTILHERQLAGPIHASPAVTAESIFVVCGDGRLVALNRSDLTLRWTLRLGEPGRYTCAPTIWEDGLFVGTPADGFYGVGTRLAAEPELSVETPQ